MVEVESYFVDVEVDGTFDIGDGDGDEFELHGGGWHWV
jgi:hypothetical protein